MTGGKKGAAMAAQKRKYRRKPKMSPSTLEGFQAGLAFATEQIHTADGREFLDGHVQGVQFALKSAPVVKRRKKPGPKPGSKQKPGPKPGSRRKPRKKPAAAK